MSESLIDYLYRDIDSLKAYVIKHFKDIEMIPSISYDIIPVINKYVSERFHTKLTKFNVTELADTIILDVHYTVKDIVDKIKYEKYKSMKTAVDENLNKLAVRNKTFYTLDQLIKKIENLKFLNKSDQDELYKEYVDTYERYKIYRSYETTKTAETTKTTQSNEPPKLPTPKKSTPRKKVQKSDSINIQKYNDIPKDIIESINKTGFKSPHKIERIIKYQNPNANINIHDIKHNLTLPIDSFPLKENKKQYSLHVVAPIGTYIMDLMFVSGLTYLIVINVNTRKAYAKNTNVKEFGDDKSETFSAKYSKSTQNIHEAFKYLIKNNPDFKPKIIRGDAEKAFDAKFFQYELKKLNITFIPVRRLSLNHSSPFDTNENDNKRNDPQHGSLSIIDRFIRTIRDMAYNMEIKNINPETMEILINNYNMAPHKHLSKYLGELTSPNDMDEDREKYIIRKICQENYNIRNQPFYRLSPGMSVDVYNEKDSMFKRRSKKRYGNYHVVDYKGGLYNVNDGDNDNIWVPRYMIAPKL